ncbi:aminotransferase class I/II-fold pyridoxal phosphate-dependent enzyme, partial [Bacillus sp. sid0103]|uniref:aminotransferase class I/II-fold pyridoxal phosphate-dependent enzyme n=1 Tax=Bacillus sp. sid0103 TaxID=2856337 RepID=UPI001C4397C1
TYEEGTFCSIASLKGIRDRTILVSGFSKGFAMTGWRLGFICAPDYFTQQIVKFEHSKELFEWIQAGAHVYVCGDEKNMAHDVQKTLVDIIHQEGGLSKEKSEEYLANMQQQKRYQRDVY